MQNEGRVLRNAALLAAGEMAGQVANLGFVILFARVYGPAAMGHYSFGMAFGAVAALGVSLGTSTWLVRELARQPGETARRIGALAPWQTLSALLIALVVALLWWKAGAGVMLAAVGYQLLYQLGSLYYAAFRASERMGHAVAGDIGHRLLLLLAAALLIALGAAPEVTSMALLLAAAARALTGRLLVRRRYGALPAAPLRDAMTMVRAASAFLGTLLLAVLYQRAAPLLLGAMRDADEVGLYAAADRIVIVAGLVAAMYGSAALPAASRMAAQDAAQARALAARLLHLLLLLVLPAGAALAVFAEDIVRLVFGVAFAPAAPVLTVLALAVPLHALENFLGAQLGAAGMQHLLLRTRLFALAAFAAMGPLFILAMDARGPALAVVLASLLQLAGAAWYLSRRWPLPLSPLNLLVPLGAAIGAAVVALLLVSTRAESPPLLQRILAFTGTLAVLLALPGGVSREDIRLVIRKLRRGHGKA